MFKAVLYFTFLLLPLAAYSENKNKVVDLVRVNDFAVTNLHLAIFSSQNPGSTDSENQPILLEELVSIFMLAHSKKGQQLAKHPEIVAAMRVNNARLIAQTLINDHMRGIAVSEQEIRDLYKQHYANRSGITYKVRQILLETKSAAYEVLKALNYGESFAKLAEKKSISKVKNMRGDMNWVSPQQMHERIAATVAGLSDGEYAKQPVQTPLGWHVVLREDSKQVPIPQLKDIRKKLLEAVKLRKLAEFIRDMRDKSDIELIAESVN